LKSQILRTGSKRNDLHTGDISLHSPSITSTSCSIQHLSHAAGIEISQDIRACEVGWRKGRIRMSVDFTTIFIVRRDRHFVLFLEIKATNHISNILTRESADQQMNDRFKGLFDDVKIPRLYGISALGSKICIYTLDRDTGDFMPQEIPTSRGRITDTAPADRWSFDIVTPGGLWALSRSCH
ncbi:hypothetical protein DFH27DRAFT_87171, partial [Peziza echinospora]